MTELLNIACVGSGTIGRSWALLFAWRGHKVRLYDVSNDVLVNSQEYIRTWLELLIKKGIMGERQLEQTMNRITLTSSLEDTVKNVDYVQESTPESLEFKKHTFGEISSWAKASAILASSTSGLLMTEIQRAAIKPERCITVHPINPPHLIPLVEIVPGKETSADVIETVYNFMLSLQKVPIKVKKEVPGFVFNRLAASLWREALDMLNNDVATVEDLDKALYAAMGLRWAIMGPFLTYHLGGGEKGLQHFIDHLGPAFSTWWKSMATWTTIPSSAAKKAVDGVKNLDMVKAKTYNELVSWRDERLMSILEQLSRKTGERI